MGNLADDRTTSSQVGWRRTLDWFLTIASDAGMRTHCFVVLAALLVCAYAGAVVWYVLVVPEVGIRCVFSSEINQFDETFLYPENQQAPRPDDVVVAIGNRSIHSWPQYLRALVSLRDRPEPLATDDPAALADPRNYHLLFQGQEIIRIRFERPPEQKLYSAWCRLGRPPLEVLLPIVLWVCIKAGLFLVGALVLWKKPEDGPARVFFWLCIASFGAYVGGYQWQRIVTQPTLLITFMVSSVLLPPVSLHFYLIFPRVKPFYLRNPRATLAGLYGPPALFLALLLSGYVRLRLSSGPGPENAVFQGLALQEMLLEIYVYFGVALLWYLASIFCLIHSYRTARDATERNQVKWILLGAVAALVPMGYSLWLALMEQDRFGGGAATWPMFAASLCVTLAFAISITRYRLMELDKVLTSGAAYLAIGVLAAVIYYALVFVGVLLLGSTVVRPSLTQALGVSTTVLLLTLVLDQVRGKLKQVLDRHFRKEKLQLDRTLERMSEAVARIVDPPTLADRLLRTAAELLGARSGAVYLRQGEPPLYRLSTSLGGSPALTELSPGCPLVECLQQTGVVGGPRAVPALSGPALAGLRQLHYLGGEAGFGLIHEGRMLAILVLGAREGGYSREEMNLLSACTRMAVLALVSGEGGRTIEALNNEIQVKVEKIAEQQRRILALQAQLARRQRLPQAEGNPPANDERPASPEPPAEAELPAPAEIVGSSPAVRQLLHLVRKVAASSSAVLLRGESGTGKELLARALHELSPRAGKPYVKVHCAALTPTLLESELFGHVKGAFTGAVKDRAGRFETANGGTLFLDEIGDVSLEVQTKLLRVLQEMTFERVGSSEPIQVDVRIVAATHQNLEKLIREGRFREDLFYRLNVFPIHVPPLRDRREDIPELAQHFLKQYAQAAGKIELRIDDDALLVLKNHSWPGNVRELENVIERAVVVAEGGVVTTEDLPAELLADQEVPSVLASAAGTDDSLVLGTAERAERERREREQLVRALAACRGNKSEAARALGVPRSTFISRLKKHGLN